MPKFWSKVHKRGGIGRLCGEGEDRGRAKTAVDEGGEDGTGTRTVGAGGAAGERTGGKRERMALCGEGGEGRRTQGQSER